MLLDVAWDKNPPDNYMLDTPLHLAAEAGHAEICQLIIGHIDDLNPCNTTGDHYTPFEYAAKGGHLEVCRVFLSCLKDKNPKNQSESCKWWTPLHSAAEYGHLEICKMIMDQISDKNPAMASGWTPLHSAADKGDKISILLVCFDPVQNIEQSFKMIEIFETRSKFCSHLVMQGQQTTWTLGTQPNLILGHDCDFQKYELKVCRTNGSKVTRYFDLRPLLAPVWPKQSPPQSEDSASF